MTTKLKQPCFIPLNTHSQSDTKNVLYYNANAPLDSIYQCANKRLQVASKLLENAYHIKTISLLQTIVEASEVLLNDAIIILEEFNPIALNLRQENNNKKD